MENQTTDNDVIVKVSNEWIGKFNAVGGWVFDNASMGFYVLGNSEENQDEARRMIRKFGGNKPNNTVQ